MNDPINDALKEFIKGVATELTRQLYSDAKGGLVALRAGLGRAYQRVMRPHFASLNDLLAAVHKNELRDGELISVNCKPSRFGPFLRRHFLPAVVGSHTNMRLGPPLVSDNFVLAIMAQAMSHLSPVGLYPHLGDDTVQATLYPSNATACGFVSMMPGVADVVPHFPAIVASRYLPYFLHECHTTGVIRVIDATALQSLGLTEEDQEVLRQQGTIWFLDVTTDESNCVPTGDENQSEMWGGLYASGHVEIVNGRLAIQDIIEAIGGAMTTAGFEPQISKNLAGAQEILLLARGCRSVLSSQAPVFSIHMDAELARGFGDAKLRFDRISNDMLTNIAKACSQRGIELANPLDLDFTYSDSAKAIRVLESLAANAIADPLAMAIRDWHRRREETAA